MTGENVTSETPVLKTRRLAAIGPCLVAGALLGWALVLAVNTTHDLQWSFEWDIFRDISIAQSLYDGRYPADPIQAGEISWYNPLTGVLLALCGLTTSQPLPRVAIVVGPYLTLLAPLCLFVLLATLFGRAEALVGLCFYLFIRHPSQPAWVGYTPFLFAPAYAMGLLFFTLTLYWHALRTGSNRWYAATGLSLGLSFLCHTSPAIIGGGVMLFMTARELVMRWKRGDNPRAAAPLLGRFLLLLAIAFVVSLPYTAPILWRYQFRMVTPWQSLYATPYVELSALPDRLREAIHWRNGLALIGVGALVARCRRQPAACMALAWGLTVAGLVAQHYLWQVLRMRGVTLTGLVPGHHAVVHLTAFRAAAFAVGVVAVGHGGGWLLLRLLSSTRQTTSAPLFANATGWAAVLIMGVLLYLSNPYGKRIDFMPPQRDLYRELFEHQAPLYAWILEHTPPEAVFMCSEESLGMTVVMPAARKLMAPMLLYSNPYTSPAPGFDRQRAILEATEQGDRTRYCDLVREYPLLFFLTRAATKAPEDFFEEAYRAGGLVAYRARACD